MPNRTPRVFRLGTILLAGACGTAFAQKDSLEKHGGHPLAKRPATLADLLDQPAWEAPPPRPAGGGPAVPAPEAVPHVDAAPPHEEAVPKRPQAVQMAPRPAPAGNVRGDLQAAIDERNRLVDRVNLFDTLERIIREEQEMAKRAAVLGAAVTRQNQAAEQADLLNHPGATMVTPEAKANAMQAWRNAEANARAARQAWQQQANVVQPLLDRVQPELGPWMESYWRMRRAVRFDRRDPDREEVLQVLDNAIRQRGDFVEGRVLAAILEVFDGNPDGAQDRLEKACEGMDKYDLFGTPFANDGCLAYLLLGRPDMVKDFITVLRKLDARRQTAFRCWLVGLSGMLECKDNEAAMYLNKALSKVDCFKPDKDVPVEAAALLGDAALFRLTAANEAQRNPDKAREILAKTRQEWDAWQLSRARAALAAADANWDEAVRQLDLCAQACPPSLQEEVAAQRKAYVDREAWVRPRPQPRPKAKVAANQ